MSRFLTILLALALTMAISTSAQSTATLRVAMAGLAHGHVDGFLRALQRRKDVEIVGVFDTDTSLHTKYQEKYHLDGSLFFTSLGAMLDKVKPEAVATFTNTFDHPVVVEACSVRKIPVMMEKPLCNDLGEARVLHDLVASTGCAVAITHTFSGYPMLREMRARLLAGEIGAVRLVLVEYLAGGIATAVEHGPDADKRWRLKPPLLVS